MYKAVELPGLISFFLGDAGSPQPASVGRMHTLRRCGKLVYAYGGRPQGLGFRVQGSGFRVQGSGFRV